MAELMSKLGLTPNARVCICERLVLQVANLIVWLSVGSDVAGDLVESKWNDSRSAERRTGPGRRERPRVPPNGHTATYHKRGEATKGSEFCWDDVRFWFQNKKKAEKKRREKRQAGDAEGCECENHSDDEHVSGQNAPLFSFLD